MNHHSVNAYSNNLQLMTLSILSGSTQYKIRLFGVRLVLILIIPVYVAISSTFFFWKIYDFLGDIRITIKTFYNVLIK